MPAPSVGGETSAVYGLFALSTTRRIEKQVSRLRGPLQPRKVHPNLEG